MKSDDKTKALMPNKLKAQELVLSHVMNEASVDAYWVDSYGGVWGTTESNFFFQGEISGGLVFAF